MIINVVVAGLLLLSPVGTGEPQPNPGGTQVEGFQDETKAGVKLTNSQIIITGTGRGGKSDGYRLKRPCWYEPTENAADMLDLQRESWPSTAWIPEEQKARKENLEKFEEKIGEEGRWWTIAHDSSDPNGLACQLAMESYVFVPPGTTPPAGITFEELADIARAALTVPEPKIELNPDAKSYVNLNTWVWLGDAEETVRSVTATLPGIMSATVTATLDSISIESGTDDDRATVVTTDCTEGGTPYAKGAKEEEFACGVQYHRASIDQPRDVYELTVTSAWDVEVQDAEVPFAYEPIEASATRDVPVGEVQSTVRKGTP
jgi:hypothetical protein